MLKFKCYSYFLKLELGESSVWHLNASVWHLNASVWGLASSHLAFMKLTPGHIVFYYSLENIKI